jgi:hypothetical protein
MDTPDVTKGQAGGYLAGGGAIAAIVSLDVPAEWKAACITIIAVATIVSGVLSDAAIRRGRAPIVAAQIDAEADIDRAAIDATTPQAQAQVAAVRLRRAER